jgi:poly(A) polymerase
MKTYMVGGCVRDEMLGLKSKDIDFTFVLDDLTGTPQDGFQKMDDWMTANGFEIFLRTPDCFTIRAKFPKTSPNAKLVADFVMARKEVGYIEGTRTPKLELGTLEDDLVRRDFTVNAMAKDEDGNLIDLFDGQSDLKRKILKTPLDPRVTMMDDPLRVLRALRFSITKGFEIDPTIWNAFRQPEIIDKLRNVVSAERIREEVFKMMQADTPGTIRLLMDVDTHHIPGFLDLVFERGMWLKPTFEHLSK